VPIALVAFFLSGFAALLYQVLWQRLLVLFAGADVHSVTLIVAAFMVGLGVGSLAGGRLASRLDARACLWAFAGAELCICAFALVSKWLYYDLLAARWPHLADTPVLNAAIVFASLLWPTIFMGVSLPLLARALTTRLALGGRVIGALYGWNTMGAAAGALIGTWVLLPKIGLERSLRLAAAISFGFAVLAIGVGRWRVSGAPPGAGPDAESSGENVGAPLSFAGWTLACALSGFVALGFEIALFRVLGVMMKSTAFTFGTLVGIYLFGLGSGAAIASRRVRTSAQPGVTFLALQCGVALFVALSSSVLVLALETGRPVKLVRYLASYDPVDVPETVAMLNQIGEPGSIARLADFAVLYLGIPLLLIAPATFLMGASFPYLQKASHQTLADLGRRLGILQAANIAGCALGAMVTGWLFLPWLGTAATLKVLVGLAALFAVPLTLARRPRATSAAIVLVVTAAAMAAMPTAPRLWASLHGTSPDRILYAEDAAGLSVLKAESATFGRQIGVHVNGLGQSWIPYGDVHTALGALPSLMHQTPRSVLIIGLGSGDTAFSAASRTETERVVTVEIIGAQRATLDRLARQFSYPGLTAVLSDPRFEHRVGDGRAYLQHTRQRFDIIQADALRPGSAYAGTLYSREYFDLVRRRLAPGGLAVTWVPTSRVARTFESVFPYVVGSQDIYIGSETAIVLEKDVLRHRAAAARMYFAAAGIDITSSLAPYLDAAQIALQPEDARQSDNLNTDTFPRDEFALPF
jgi:spermidine synthase